MKIKALIGICGMVFVFTASANEASSNEEGEGPRFERQERKGPKEPKGQGQAKRPPRAPLGEMFKRMDKDRDGKITKDEFFAGPRLERLSEENRRKIFERLDRNDDGVLDREEIREIRKDGEERRRRELRELDKDGNGGLSFEEMSRGEFFGKLPEEKRRQIFKRMDTDGSGEINAEDRPKGPPGKRGGRREGPERKPKG